MLENLIKSIEIFDTGSVCVDMNRHIEDIDDLQYYERELNAIYNDFDKNKISKKYVYNEGGKKTIHNVQSKK